MNKTELPEDVTLAGKVLDTEARKNEMGKIGQWFGSTANASVYLAAIIIAVSVVIGGLVVWNEPALRPDYLKAVLALAIAALGYMFGTSRRSDGP